MFYTYLWLRVNGTPYYVGKGKSDRAFISYAHGVHRPVDDIRIIVQDHPSEEEAFEAEIFLIAYYGRMCDGTGCLRNIAEGGQNPPKGRRKGMRNSQELNDRISATLKRKGIKPPNQTGFHHSEETRKRISASMKVFRNKETHGLSY